MAETRRAIEYLFGQSDRLKGTILSQRHPITNDRIVNRDIVTELASFTDDAVDNRELLFWRLFSGEQRMLNRWPLKILTETMNVIRL